jgi:hypothetical protein
LHTRENAFESAKVLESPLIEKDLTEKEADVLISMVERGEATQYEIFKEKGISFQLVHHIFKRLQDKSLIRKLREERSDRNVAKKIYKPTLAGLLFAYVKRPENPNIIKRVGEFFPLIVGKLDLFRRYRIDNIMMDSFMHFISGDWGFLAYRISKGDSEKELAKSWTKKFFHNLFFFGSPTHFFWRRVTRTQGEEIQMICEAIATDSELRRFIRPIIKDLHKWHGGMTSVFKEVERMLESREKTR